MANQAVKNYFYGTGKRKTSIAKVRLYPTNDGNGLVTINDKPLDMAFPWITWKTNVMMPFKTTGTEKQFNVVAQVSGGGVSSQSEAVRHGISKALLLYDENFRAPLRKKNLLTRDSRIKESKKYGLKRARRAPQYTKR